MTEFERLMAELEDCHCACGSCDCSEVLDNLFELLDRHVPTEDAHRLLRHGAECPTCSERIDAELRVRQTLRRSCCSDVAPAALRIRISQMTIRRRVD